MSDSTTPSTCQNCGGNMVPTDVEDQLFVRRRGEGRRDGWSASQLDSFSCTDCGRTDLYASHPDRLRQEG
jgi:ribosomal protein S27AE